MGNPQTWRNDPQFKPFYKRKAWKDVRAFVWDRAHGLCERCLENGKVVPAEIVHHRIPLNASNVSDPDISLNPERLIALCKECHEEEHRRIGIGALNGHLHDKEKPRVGFDSDGNVMRL